jgi:hypothetical protein
MEEIEFEVPTYYGGRTAAGDEYLPEFGGPYVPVITHSADGVRIVLGSHEWQDVDHPDIAIERRPHGWAIFLNPIGGSDSAGVIYFTDEGRSFVVPANDFGTTPPIVMYSWESASREVDGTDAESTDRADQCELCDLFLDPENGDNWDDLCPSCADLVSAYLDAHKVHDRLRHAVVRILRRSSAHRSFKLVRNISHRTGHESRRR